MNKVGRDYIDLSMKRKFSYRDIQSESDGWVDASRYLPADYDLMSLKIKGKDILCGWSVGAKWDGLKIKKSDKILFWKKKSDESTRCKTVLQ
jgi:hypothetical protein